MFCAKVDRESFFPALHHDMSPGSQSSSAGSSLTSERQHASTCDLLQATLHTSAENSHLHRHQSWLPSSTTPFLKAQEKKGTKTVSIDTAEPEQRTSAFTLTVTTQFSIDVDFPQTKQQSAPKGNQNLYL